MALAAAKPPKSKRWQIATEEEAKRQAGQERNSRYSQVTRRETTGDLASMLRGLGKSMKSIDRQERWLDPAKMTENAEKAAETVSTAVSDVTVRVSTEARKRWRKAGMMASVVAGPPRAAGGARESEA